MLFSYFQKIAKEVINMLNKEMCTIRCKLFQQRMNFPLQGKYSGLCDAREGQLIYSEDVTKYDRYGTASRSPCIATEAKELDEDMEFDPFGWMGPED